MEQQATNESEVSGSGGGAFMYHPASSVYGYHGGSMFALLVFIVVAFFFGLLIKVLVDNCRKTPVPGNTNSDDRTAADVKAERDRAKAERDRAKAERNRAKAERDRAKAAAAAAAAERREAARLAAAAAAAATAAATAAAAERREAARLAAAAAERQEAARLAAAAKADEEVRLARQREADEQAANRLAEERRQAIAAAAARKVEEAAAVQAAEELRLRTLARRAAEKVQEAMQQAEIDATAAAARHFAEYMEGKSIEFDGYSWNIDDRPKNREILQGIAAIMYKREHVMLKINGVQKGATGQKGVQRFEETYPNEVRPLKRAFTAQGRVLACKNVLIEMGVDARRMITTSEIGAIRQVQFIAQNGTPAPSVSTKSGGVLR